MRASEAGSAVIEAMVALAIVAGILAAAAASAGSSARQTRAAEAKRAAVMVAQSRLDAVGAETPAAPGTTDGQDGALAWRTVVAPAAAGPSAAGQLLDVQVDVVAAGGGPVLAHLHSLRVVPVRAP